MKRLGFWKSDRMRRAFCERGSGGEASARLCCAVPKFSDKGDVRRKAALRAADAAIVVFKVCGMHTSPFFVVYTGGFRRIKNNTLKGSQK